MKLIRNSWKHSGHKIINEILVMHNRAGSKSLPARLHNWRFIRKSLLWLYRPTGFIYYLTRRKIWQNRGKIMRKTKIICTIGPACEDVETLTKMCEAGMNVARLNFSHGTHEEHLKKINLVKEVRESLNLPIPIMLDTKGPEYRIKTFR